MMSPIFQTENKRGHVNLKDVGMGVGGFQQTFKVYIEKLNSSTIFDKKCIYVCVLLRLKSSPYRSLYNSTFQYVDTFNETALSLSMLLPFTVNGVNVNLF